MSHKRSPVAEQSVETVHLSPIFGEQPLAAAKAASATPIRSEDGVVDPRGLENAL